MSRSVTSDDRGSLPSTSRSGDGASASGIAEARSPSAENGGPRSAHLRRWAIGLGRRRRVRGFPAGSSRSSRGRRREPNGLLRGAARGSQLGGPRPRRAFLFIASLLLELRLGELRADVAFRFIRASSTRATASRSLISCSLRQFEHAVLLACGARGSRDSVEGDPTSRDRHLP